MLLKEERKGERPKSESISYGLSVSTRSGEVGPEKCKICKKNHGGVYWDERSDLASGWLQEKRGTKRKCTETESATAAMVYLF